MKELFAHPDDLMHQLDVVTDSDGVRHPVDHEKRLALELCAEILLEHGIMHSGDRLVIERPDRRVTYISGLGVEITLP